MWPSRLLAMALGGLAGLCGAAPDPQAAPLQVQSAPQDPALAQKLFRAALADRRAQVIAAESGEFADRMAAIYLQDGSNADWRAQVGRIHDPARVSAMLLAALRERLAQRPDLAERLRVGLVASGVAPASDGQGLELAARVQLTRHETLAAVLRRLAEDDARGAPVLAAIRRMMTEDDQVAQLLAAQLNREIAFARGFSDAGGFGFPAELDDVAADLSLQLPEQQAQTTAQRELALFAAFAPLGAEAVDRIAAARASAQSRLLAGVLALAEGDVLDQLAAESGRAAATRDEGNPL